METRMQEAKAFRSLMRDLKKAISSPDSIAFDVYAAGIINEAKRDEICDSQQSLNKKQVLLKAVEAQIQLQPKVYYEFLEILSEEPSLDFICQKMREKCGKSQLCIVEGLIVYGVIRAL